MHLIRLGRRFLGGTHVFEPAMVCGQVFYFEMRAVWLGREWQLSI
jgi:hypothetical protein